MRVLFCGINSSLYAAVTGHHFSRPGNRFWPTLHAAGFTDRRLDPDEEQGLLNYGYGITNLVKRVAAAAAELTPAELISGRGQLEAKVYLYRPRAVAVLGVGAYRTAFARAGAAVGQQAEPVGSAPVWVLPNPSDLNAHYPPPRLASIFRSFRLAVEK